MGMDNVGTELSGFADDKGISCELANNEMIKDEITIIANIFFCMSADRYSALGCFYFFANPAQKQENFWC
jgi:hypothetical protein